MESSDHLIQFTPEKIKDVIDNLKSCQEIVKENLVNDIEIYQELKSLKNKKQFAVNNLISTLDRINKSIGWKTFIQLFGITKEDKEPITFTDVLPILNGAHAANLPWGVPPISWLFDMNTEELMLDKIPPFNIKNESIIGQISPLNPFDTEIAKRLQLGTQRDKHIMDLYLNLCIAECFGNPVNAKEGPPTANKKNTTQNLTINGKSLKDYVKEILKKHYDHKAAILSKQKVFPEKIDINSALWNNLLIEANNLRDKIIEIKNNYLEIISGYKFEEKYSVFNDIWSFLIKNNLPEFVPPSISLLQSEKYKAYGLVKKISKGPTMAVVRKEYTPWVINQKSDSSNASSISDKIRIYELARDLNLENKDILDAAQKLSITVKSHSSSISIKDAEKIRQHILNKNTAKIYSIPFPEIDEIPF